MKETDEKLKHAMWNNSKEFMKHISSDWKPTNQLRWQLAETPYDRKQGVHELRQKWISDSGEEEWRAIPFVEK